MRYACCMTKLVQQAHAKGNYVKCSLYIGGELIAEEDEADGEEVELCGGEIGPPFGEDGGEGCCRAPWNKEGG